jgi:steroid delta-isomerase-like uncharacterized protein
VSEDNKQVARRFIDAFLTGDTALLEKVMVEDAVDHNPPFGGTSGGRQAVAGAVAAYRAAFPGMEITVEREVAEGDCVVQYGFISGTNDGPMMGMPATGKRVRFAYMDMHRIVDGRIVETWHLEDIAGLLRQLGAL